jgi:hypothetical protein
MLTVMQPIHAHITVTFGIKISNFRVKYLKQLRQDEYFDNLQYTFLVNDQRDAHIPFYVFIFVYNYLHVSSTSCSSSGETTCANTTSGNSHTILVSELCAGWK